MQSFEERRSAELKAELVLLDARIDRSVEEELNFRQRWLVTIDGRPMWRTTATGPQAPELQRELDAIVNARAPLIDAKNNLLSELAALSTK